MADIEYFDDGSGYGRGRYDGGYAHASRHTDRGHTAQPEPHAGSPDTAGASLGRLVNWAGAFVSLGLVVGMGVWAWQLTVRDVSGVPVIEALEGPMRISPEDPEGIQAPHQGLAVNRIAEGNEAEPVPDQVVLAPPPVDLDAIDLAVEPAPAARAAADNVDTQALINRLLERAGPSLDAADAATTPDVIDETAEVATQTPAATVAQDVTPSVIPASIPGVSRSLRPLLRPADLDTTAVSSSASIATGGQGAVSASGGVQELTIADLPAGTRLVQLGAFDSADIARAEWDRLAGRFPDFFAGRARVVQQATSGGQAFFRLRANGFETLDESRRFCAAMVAQGAACIPVTLR